MSFLTDCHLRRLTSDLFFFFFSLLIRPSLTVARTLIQYKTVQYSNSLLLGFFVVLSLYADILPVSGKQIQDVQGVLIDFLDAD